MKTRGMVVTLLLAGTATALFGHDLFMKLDTYFLTADSQVTIPVYNGTFMQSENSITTNRLLDISVVGHGNRMTIGTDHWLAGENNHTSYLTIPTGAPGTYVVGASTKHTDFELAAADFNAYLEHDGIPDVLEDRRRDGELDRDVWERYGKHIKAIVQVGEVRTNDFSTPLGYPAEIVPLANPYALRVGDEITVQCLVDGQPVANQLVTAGGHGENGAMDETSKRTDAYGKVTFSLREAGRWYVKFINMVEVDSDPELDYESKWATVSFEIQSEP